MSIETLLKDLPNKETPVDGDSLLISNSENNGDGEITLLSALKTYITSGFNYFDKTVDNSDNITESATKKFMLDTERTKLTGITDGADVTNTASVESAGAVMDTDVIDEDDMVSDSDTKVPTQQSVKAYVDNNGGDSSSYAMLADYGASSVSLSANGAFRLNTVVYDADSIVTLSAYQFTLQAGTYLVSGLARTFDSGNDWAIIYNITDSAIEYNGGSGWSDTSDPTSADMPLDGIIEITTAKTFEIRSGAGTFSMASGTTSVMHSFIKLTKIA